MKMIFLVFCLVMASQSAFAEVCSEAAAGVPCAPDPGAETEKVKSAIMRLIKLAKAADSDVRELEEKFRAVRDNPQASTEEKLAACEPYRKAKKAQDELYKEAMRKTEKLYHVGPNSRRITIGKPADPSIDYVSGLKAVWNPQVTESGPGVKLALKIKGADKEDHYTGATKMNPRERGGKQAVTSLDGRVFILKASFDMAREKNNPGWLASLLYHESRHFNQLSRPVSEASKARRSAASNEEAEVDAYSDVIAYASEFGLSDADIRELESLLNVNSQAVADNNLTYPGLTPDQERTWKDAYQRQLNLEEEYESLQKAVQESRRKQEDAQRSEREFRERLARLAEEGRLARERAAIAVWQDIHAAAAVCGYAPRYQRNGGKFMGYDAQNELYIFRAPVKSPMTTNDYRIGFLVARACYEAVHNPERASPRACNGAATLLRSFAAQSDFAARLNDIFGARDRRCINHVFDPANKITDTASFDKVIAKYHKQLIKEQREYDKIWRSNPPRSDDGNRGGERQPRDNNRSPSDPDHDEVWRRINPIIKP